MNQYFENVELQHYPQLWLKTDGTNPVLYTAFIPSVFVFSRKYGNVTGSGTGLGGSGNENKKESIPPVLLVSRIQPV